MANNVSTSSRMTEVDDPPRKRRKVSLACVPCRERKIRCSGEKPVCASCHRRSEECNYAVRLESIPEMTGSIQSVLDRLQRLESQNQALGHGQSISNAGSELQSSARESEDHTLLFDNVQSPSEHSVRPSPTCDDEKRKRGMSPRTRPSSDKHLRHPSSNISYIAAIAGPTEFPWKPEENNASQEMEQETEQETEQAPSNVADAMGASSVCDKSSPEESTQYYGGSSGIAFMRAICQVLGDKGQEESFLENVPSLAEATNLGFKQTMRSELLKLFPKFEGPKFRPDLFALPSRSLSDTLLENYWTRVHPLCSFLHRRTFEAAYATLWNPPGGEYHLAQESDAGLGNIFDAGPSHQNFYCALNMMLALGTQFLDVSVSERKNITSMFELRSKNLLVVDMMDRGSIAVVQTLLLNGQYLQSTFCSQRCWNCIGVACRIAQGLGLHVDQSPAQKSSLGQEMRRRVWYACMMLDVSGSMTMGRPLMILHKFSTSPPSPLDDETQKSMQNLSIPAIGAFLEGIKLSNTLGVILTTIYDQTISNSNTGAGNPKHIQTPIEIDAVLELDKRLTKFQNELPIEFRWAPEGEKLRQSLGTSAGTLDMQSNALHARFLQSRILLFRTTFIQLCQDAVSKMYEVSPSAFTDSEFEVDAFFVTRGAASCVASARELLKLIHRTALSASSDAWWYNVYYAHTAGMVVKLAQLCYPLKQIVTAASLDESWDLCRNTLSRMSVYGQVPRRCLESLEAMQQKISHLEHLNSRPNSQAKQQGVPCINNFAPPSFQDTNPSYSSGQIQMLQGQPEQFADVEGLLDNATLMSRTPRGLGSGGGVFSDWSKEFTDLWSFPGGEFGFDDLAFTQ